MNKKEKVKSGEKPSPVVPTDDEKQPVCEKAFTPETARSKDKDEPCKDGVG